MAEKNIFLNGAAKAGLALGGVSILFMLLTWLLGRIDSTSTGVMMAISVVNILLWVAKFVGCLLLMRFFMRRFSAMDPKADNSRVFRFGMLTSLLSAVVYSAFYMAYLMFVAPETIDMVLDVIRENPMMNSSSIAMAEEIAPMLPTYSFFGNLIYCFLYGTIVAAIFSRNIPPRNPFAGEDFNRQ